MNNEKKELAIQETNNKNEPLNKLQMECSEQPCEQYLARCYECFHDIDGLICPRCLATCHFGHHVSKLFITNNSCHCKKNNKCKNNNPFLGGEFKECEIINKLDKMHTKLQIISKQEINDKETKSIRTNEGSIKITNTFVELAEIINNFSFHAIDKLNHLTDKNVVLSSFSTVLNLLPIFMLSSGITETELGTIFRKHNKNQLWNGINIIQSSLYKNKIIKSTNFFISDKDIVVVNKNDMLKRVFNFCLFDVKNENEIISNVNKINNYIASITNNKIMNCLKTNDINKDTNIALLNVTTVQTYWDVNFDAKMTETKIFYNNPYNKTDVLMMQMKHKKSNYYENDNAQLLELFLEGKHMTVGFLLAKNQIDIPTITNNKMQELITRLKEHELKEIQIPKFTQKNKLKMNMLIQRLGVTSIFDENKFTADRIKEKVKISDMYHEVVINVNENEITDPLATISENVVNSPNTNLPSFIANHPFVYYLRFLPTNTVLMTGTFK